MFGLLLFCKCYHGCFSYDKHCYLKRRKNTEVVFFPLESHFVKKSEIIIFLWKKKRERKNKSLLFNSNKNSLLKIIFKVLLIKFSLLVNFFCWQITHFKSQQNKNNLNFAFMEMEFWEGVYFIKRTFVKEHVLWNVILWRAP